MSQIIEHCDDSNLNNSTVSVVLNEPNVSLKTYQDIYHQITGRTEKIQKKYSNDIEIVFSDIEELHIKIMQLCDVYSIIAKNEVITVFHEKERKEQFTSFERFKLYNVNSSKPTVSFVMKYNFSILLPDVKKPQEYIVSVRLTSRLAMLNAMEEEVLPFIKNRMFAFVNRNTAVVSVEYADYVIARTFIHAFDDWIHGCKAGEKNKYLDFAQEHSHKIPNIVKIVLAIILFCFSLNSYDQYYSSLPITFQIKFLVTFCFLLYIVNFLSVVFGRMIEYSLDSFNYVSYLKLNKGDDKLIEKVVGRNKYIKRDFFQGCALTILLGIMSSFVFDILKIYL